MNVQGLATVLTSDDMLEWFRVLYAIVRDRVLEQKPGATRLLEKTPDHAMCLDVIRQVVPDAQVLFLVRDPRETVRSMLHASAEPWGHWASTAVEGRDRSVVAQRAHAARAHRRRTHAHGSLRRPARRRSAAAASWPSSLGSATRPVG